MTFDKSNPGSTNAALQLGWLTGASATSLDILVWLGRKAREAVGLGPSEWDTASVVVEPILRGLGWDTLDFNQVWRENRSPRTQLADIQLVQKKKIVVLIEVKQLSYTLDKDSDKLKSLTDPQKDQFVGQLWAYGNRLLNDSQFEQKRCVRNREQFLWGLLTNGRVWLLYDLAQAYKKALQDLHSRIYPFDEFSFDALQDHIPECLLRLTRESLSQGLNP
jgi:hypothetical protein